MRVVQEGGPVKLGPQAGGGGDLYNNATPTPVTIGGIPAGSTFTNQTMQQMWDALLYPYLDPAFTSFQIAAQTNPLEVGDTVLANRTFTWTTSNSGNVEPNTVDIRDMTLAYDIVTGIANSGSYVSTIASITKLTNATHQFRIQALNTNLVPFNRFYNINWQWRRYWGESVNAGPLTEADIEALSNSGLSSTFAGAYVFAGGGYKYIAYATALGTATTFKDAGTGFDVAMEAPYVVSVTNSFGVTTNYWVHRTTNIMGSAITINVS